jgi:hypothetical protein
MIGHHDAMAEAVERLTDIGGTPRLRAFDSAQRGMDDDGERREEGADHDGADQYLPEHVGLDGGEIRRRIEVCAKRAAGRPGRGDRDQAWVDPRRNQISAACLPVLASHQSPADFNRGVSGLARFIRVNACGTKRKIRLKSPQLPGHDYCSVNEIGRLISVGARPWPKNTGQPGMVGGTAGSRYGQG